MNLLNEVLKNKEQGYAFYYQDENQKITKVNGKLADINSNDISFDTDLDLHQLANNLLPTVL